MDGCWTDAKTKEGGISTELSDRVNHTNSSSYYLFFYLAHAILVFIFPGTSPVSQVDSKSTGDIVCHTVWNPDILS